MGYYGALICFERGEDIPRHLSSFILKREEGPELYMRLDELVNVARLENHKLTRHKIIGVLSSLGHVSTYKVARLRIEGMAAQHGHYSR